MKQTSYGFAASLGLIGCLAALSVYAQSPTNHPVAPHLPTAVRAPQSTPATASEPVQLPPLGQQGAPPIRPAAVAAPAPNIPSTVDACLVWDSIHKTVPVTNGTSESHFTFNLTNISTGDVTISNATASCGCTVAQLPKTPWTITSGGHGDINVTMNVAGKSGAITKEITLVTDKGIKKLSVTTDIKAPTVPQMSDVDRANNQKIALADRQAVFKGDCAKCHVEPVKGKWGKELYDTACGICHEGEHRAAMVPNLHALPQPTNADYWRYSIVHGKTNSLMPAFAVSEGGILSDMQVNALVSYLSVTIPSRPVSANQPAKPPGG
jgi:cytochrome c5